jgi:hypothetical protein
LYQALLSGIHGSQHKEKSQETLLKAYGSKNGLVAIPPDYMRFWEPLPAGNELEI